MGNRPVMAGAPTVEVNMTRYEELLHAEVKCEQYKKAVALIAPAIVSTIEATDFETPAGKERCNGCFGASFNDCPNCDEYNK